MILGAVCRRGALCTPESELESCRSFYALCFLFFSTHFCISPRVLPGAETTCAPKCLVSVTAAPGGQAGRIFLLQPQHPGLCPRAGAWGVSCPPQLVCVFTYRLENILGTFARKGGPTMGSLKLPQPLTWPCTGGTFSLTLRIRNAELGAGGAGGAVVGTPWEWGAAPQVKVQALVHPELLACPANPVLPQSQFLLPKCWNNGFPGCPKTKPFLKQPKPPPPLCSFLLLFRFVQGRQAPRVDKLRCHPAWGHHPWGLSRALGSQHPGEQWWELGARPEPGGLSH